MKPKDLEALREALYVGVLTFGILTLVFFGGTVLKAKLGAVQTSQAIVVDEFGGPFREMRR